MPRMPCLFRGDTTYKLKDVERFRRCVHDLAVLYFLNPDPNGEPNLRRFIKQLRRGQTVTLGVIRCGGTLVILLWSKPSATIGVMTETGFHRVRLGHLSVTEASSLELPGARFLE